MAPVRTPLLSRKLDTVYLVWFALHLAVMLCVDLVSLYPAWLQPEPLLQLRKWYIVTYNDRFFINPPAWFTLFLWIEAIYHVPLSVWAIFALIRDDPLVPIHLLIWAVQTAITTLTCITDYRSWAGLSLADRQGLDGLYVSYCLLSVFVGLDMTWRLQKTLRQHHKAKRH